MTHGGLFSKDGVTLQDIRKTPRKKEPGDEGIMCETLWSDPSDENGRHPSKRGVGVQFGPDVAAKFLDDNALGKFFPITPPRITSSKSRSKTRWIRTSKRRQSNHNILSSKLLRSNGKQRSPDSI